MNILQETPDEKLAEIGKDLALVQAEAHNYPVASVGDVALATEFLARVKSRHNRVEELRVAFTGPLNDLVKSYNAQFKPYLKALEEIESQVKGNVAAFVLAQEKLRRIEEENLRKQHDKDMAKASKDANKKGLLFVPTDTPEVQSKVALVKTESGKATNVITWKFEILDTAQIPREYCTPDEKLIRQAVQNGERKIKGVRIFEDVQVRIS